MEKSRNPNIRIVYSLWAAQTFQNKPIMKLGIPQPPHYPFGVKRVHVNSPNVEGTVFQTF